MGERLDLPVPLFDPAAGEVVREPEGAGAGWWAGAPGVWVEPDGATYLTYRLRRPRGEQNDRGGEARVARSDDGVRFEDVWRVTKDAYGSASIERSALVRGADGLWRYFTSYVSGGDGRWQVDVIESADPAKLDPAERRTVFSAASLGVEGVKDPTVLRAADGRWAMFVSVALATEATGEHSHATHDIYNTGECRSATALATSADLAHWDWSGVVLNVAPGAWDGYCARLTGLLELGEGYLGFYDGEGSHERNYEEKCGLARSRDLASWTRLTPGGPALVSPHASGSVRYVWPVRAGLEVRYYYEFARGDGAHDLRVARAAL